MLLLLRGRKRTIPPIVTLPPPTLLRVGPPTVVRITSRRGWNDRGRRT